MSVTVAYGIVERQCPRSIGKTWLEEPETNLQKTEINTEHGATA